MEQFYDDFAEDGPAAEPRRQQQPSPSIVLPPFWTTNVTGWFAMAESRFRIRRIYDEWDRYDNLVSALTADSIRLVLDVVTNPPEEDPYTHLKERLMGSHQLTDYQRIEQLIAMDSLGDRKPSQLLAQMLEVCPAGEERSKFFAFHFLQRIPQELRIMLGEDNHEEIHQLAVKADRLWAIHGHRLHGSVAAVASPEDPLAVNAVRGGRGGRVLRGRGRGRGSQPARGGASAPAAAATGLAPAALARDSAGLCYYHWNFGEKATKCEAQCSWQGN